MIRFWLYIYCLQSCCVWFMYIIISCLYYVIKLGCEQLIHGRVDHIFVYHVMWFLLVFISLCISCALLTTGYNGWYTWSWREEYSRYELFCNFTFHLFTVDTVWSPFLYNNRGTNSSIIHKPWKHFYLFFLVKSRFEWKKNHTEKFHENLTKNFSILFTSAFLLLVFYFTFNVILKMSCEWSC